MLGAEYFGAGAGAVGIEVPGYFCAITDPMPIKLKTQARNNHPGIETSGRHLHIMGQKVTCTQGFVSIRLR
jgi:hypothetical protein